MDVATLAASAGISAVISAVMTVLLVPQATVRQMRAEAREQAAASLAKISKELHRQVLMHEDSENPRGVRDGTKVVSEDLSHAQKIMKAAESLGPFRRQLVTRRAEKLFGVWTVKHARLMRDDSSDSAFAAWIRAALKGDKPIEVALGSWHTALSVPSGSPAIKDCLRDLRALERRW